MISVVLSIQISNDLQKSYLQMMILDYLKRKKDGNLLKTHVSFCEITNMTFIFQKCYDYDFSIRRFDWRGSVIAYSLTFASSYSSEVVFLFNS